VRTMSTGSMPSSSPTGLVVLEERSSVEPGREVSTVEARVPDDLPLFRGHFDGDPILPGVAQLEILLEAVESRWPDLGSLEEVPRLKHSSPVRPGQVLHITVTRKTKPELASEVSFRIARREHDEVCTTGIFRFALADCEAS